jgi:hypothetical protein
MLAPSKPWAKNIARAPSMICNRFWPSPSSAAAVSLSWVVAIIVFLSFQPSLLA